ncbi:MAG TPA: hypothetical protein VHS55_06890 [Solirubrobacteraceae bacterium]|nr:hypothetical protein [Solirubrobacteraceae bacterium]
MSRSSPDGTTAPIWVSVAFDEDAVMLDVCRFAAHLIQGIVREAQRAGTLSSQEREAILTAAADRRPLPGKERRRGATRSGACMRRLALTT